MKFLTKLDKTTASNTALCRGNGLVSGVIALSLAILGFLGMLAFLFGSVARSDRLNGMPSMTALTALTGATGAAEAGRVTGTNGGAAAFDFVIVA